ncbi:MAG TPA: hypothetical protein VG389_00315 [Myxococcota bacterium]|nr:hypothetical protein [Myxococcota bacterium]
MRATLSPLLLVLWLAFGCGGARSAPAGAPSAAGGKASPAAFCRGSAGLVCLTEKECEVDRKRGCTVCRCRPVLTPAGMADTADYPSDTTPR